MRISVVQLESVLAGNTALTTYRSKDEITALFQVLSVQIPTNQLVVKALDDEGDILEIAVTIHGREQLAHALAQFDDWDFSAPKEVQ